MANMLFANNCNTTLSSSITNVATTLSVTSATGFPSPTGSQYFYCTLADAATQTTIEIVKVTAVSGTTFTIVRGQDGTSGTIFASGAVVSLRLVRASLNDFPKLDEANTFTFAPTFNTALAVGSGGTGLTSFTNGGVVFANSTSTLTTSTGLTYSSVGDLIAGTGSSIAFSANPRFVDNISWNGAASAMYVGKVNGTARSINAAGTVNAAGLDYAEYMTKAGDFIIAKGDICGIDLNGKLTNIFDDSISFVVKSTSPSYVGGDTWGIGLEGDALELARQTVDRIAFCGQVPVNVTGATAGQYIVPIVNQDGSIGSISVSNPTFEQYQLSVGKVISVIDGKPTIIVKVS